MMFAIALVALASFAAGFINALAGGGSFLTLPALIAAGVPPIAANASSTVALFPGQITTGFAARDGIRAAAKDHRINVPALAAISLGGGLVGGLLLLVTPAELFARIIPWLILFATLVFAGGNLFRSESGALPPEPRRHPDRAGLRRRLWRLFRRRHRHSRCWPP